MMNKRTIRLAYRKVIDSGTQNVWEKYVHDATYQEFLIQAQNYNPEKKYSTFSELLHHIPNAEKLHFLVSASVINYLKQLNGKVPDILNNLGRLFLPFTKYRFEIIESDIHDRSKHRVVIEFISEQLKWLDTIDNLLLIAPNNDNKADEGMLTEMLAIRPFLSIHSLKQD